MIPCAAARVPRFDAYMLRMFLSDSPAESKSSWQMEAIDTRNILTDVTEKSLVLVRSLDCSFHSNCKMWAPS